MRSRFSMTLPLLVLACTASASAQTQKFAVIDMQSALVNTKDGQKAVAELKAKFTPKEQEFQKRQSDLQAKQDEYRRTENTISEEKKAALAADIDRMTKSLQRDTDDARQDVDQEQQRVLNDLGQKMMQVLQKYASDKQLTMVFDVSGQPNNVLYASNTVDITRDIIGLYDSAAPTTSATPLVKPPVASSPTTRTPAAGSAAPTPAAPRRTTPAPAAPAK